MTDTPIDFADARRLAEQMLKHGLHPRAMLNLARAFLAVLGMRIVAADTLRLDWLFDNLPFDVTHRFGGDPREFREGIDAAMDTTKEGA